MGRKLSIWVATRFIDEVQAEFSEAFSTHFASPRERERSFPDAMAEAGGAFDALVHSLDVPMPAERIAALPESVRALATYSVGTDHIDLEAARRRGIAVFNTPGVLADSVAENAIFLMLGAARRATESIELLRSGEWSGWTPTQLVGVQLSGRVLGVLGLGEIGTRIASRAEALGMSILYCNRKPAAAAEARGWGYRPNAAGLVRDCDVLMLACPSTPETRGIIDARLLGQARPGMLLVNIARGNLVDDEALLEALGEGRVWAAGLDVFAGEPHIAPGYFERPNVFMLPHIGSSTVEARVAMGRILIRALRDWQAGHEASNRVI